MSQHPYTPEDLRLLGGTRCLDYVNTIENRASQTPEEFLFAAEDVVRWGAHAALLAPDAAARLRAWAVAGGGGEDTPQVRAFRQALAVRETLHALFLALATEEPLPDAALAELQAAWAGVMRTARLTPVGDVSAEPHLAWTWLQTDGSSGLDPIIGPVLASALALLTDLRSDLGRVKVCANPHGCGWLFYDSSRNASRRWCSMEGCGSQIKMQRQYARTKAARAAEQ